MVLSALEKTDRKPLSFAAAARRVAIFADGVLKFAAVAALTGEDCNKVCIFIAAVAIRLMCINLSIVFLFTIAQKRFHLRFI